MFKKTPIRDFIWGLKNKWSWMRKKTYNTNMRIRKEQYEYRIKELKEKYEEQLKALPEILENLKLVEIRIERDFNKQYQLVTKFDPYAMQAMFCHGYNEDPYFEYLADYISHKVVCELKRHNITRDLPCQRG